jgi:hypothetical protein
MEIWKDIDGYNGLYQVSNEGRIRSKYKILKTRVSNNGYLRVNLYLNTASKTCNVHRLVATTHISNPNNYPYVMHLDNDKTNNSAYNLQWGTQSMNMQQCVAENRHARMNQYTTFPS